MRFPRSSGILLHPTSLPGPFGIGDLGAEAERFIDFLAAAGQSLWQVLPLGPTGYGDSPYACFSAFAGNPLLVSLERLADEGLLTRDELAAAPDFPTDRVDFGPVITFKMGLLERAYERFAHDAAADDRARFAAFCGARASWLEDYATFRALKDAHAGAAWNTWPTELAGRQPTALAQAKEMHRGRIERHAFFQYLFFEQWERLRERCRERGVTIVGDIPIFVAYDSADVWASPELFKLNPDGTPQVVAGVPPDYFSKTGQLWGNPLYDWKTMAATQYAWWIARVRQVLSMVDIVRLDHFRGFAACWEVPHGDKTAVNGAWVKVPGEDFFTALKTEFGDLPLIAEDLGVITPDVEELRDGFGFPGMRILQFAFGGDAKNHDLPHNYVPNAVAYTGTHDNDTTVGWFQSRPAVGSTRDAKQIERERAFCLEYLRSDGTEIHWDFIRTVQASVADIALVPMQDLLGLGSDARMNLPASTKGNWGWRFGREALTDDLAARLRRLSELYGRTAPLPSLEEADPGGEDAAAALDEHPTTASATEDEP